MNIIGIQAFYYSHAAALLSDGDLKFFVENEKIKRIKAERDDFPTEAIRSALDFTGLCLDHIDEIVYPQSPIRYALVACKQGSRSLVDALWSARKRCDGMRARRSS